MQDNQALIVVDVQKDFLETGALPVKEGSQVVPVINRIIPKFKNVVFTQDWHPEGHISFASSHPGEALYSMIDVSYGKQVLWPEHCVQDTAGAEFAEGLNTDNGVCFVKKGAHPNIDSYSAFLEADRKTKTDLAVWLKSQGINEVFVCGLATDFCVSWTALDAADEGFKVYVIEDACRGIDVNGSLEAARAEWKKSRNKGPAEIEPSTPVSTTKEAESAGRPPSFSAIDMAIGVVTLFGAKLMMVSGDAPRSPAIRTVEVIAVTAPAKSPNKIGSQFLAS